MKLLIQSSKYLTEMELVYKDLVTREDQSDHCID
jgi:hypothetical protein